MSQRVYKKIISYLLQKILAKNLENHIQKSGAILEVTNKLHQVRNVSYVHFLNRTPNTSYRIPQYADIEKRQVDRNMLSGNSDFQLVTLTMPNGDLYFNETYSRQ